MTGPEAYRHALKLAAQAADRPFTDDGRTLAILSGTYATLALAAATVDSAYSAMSIEEAAPWTRVVRAPRQPDDGLGWRDHEIDDPGAGGPR